MNGDKVYIWQERTDEGWGILAFWQSETPVPLVTRKREIAESVMSVVAYQHQARYGNPIRLGEFSLEEVLQQEDEVSQ